jgi:radical SAM protein with 4Fe4S-binding SPASM domain
MKAGPDYIQFYPTLRCNRSCGFCFNRGLSAQEDISLPEFHLLLDRLPDTVSTVDILGGEPTMHNDILALVDLVRQQGLKVNLSSNGGNRDILRQIRVSCPDVSIGLSINDRQTLEELRGFIRSYAPVVKSVYARDLDPCLIENILAAGPQRYYLLYRDVLIQAALGEAVPFPEFVAGADRMGAGKAGTVYCSGFLPDTRHYPELASVRCPAGTTKLGILPDGSVYPCNLFFSRPDYKLGNVLSDSFDAIWRHPALEFFRKPQSNACGRTGCTLHAECHGGCPAQALLLTGDLAAPDPRCSLRP